ncbi:porin [Isoalcanivorax beigongshangi]|uniref:Porin n=1 Tax=Isoalcanivorax beigongshangi TaxID=3238810 RepID=A0ABV4AJW0_9GAMM
MKKTILAGAVALAVLPLSATAAIPLYEEGDLSFTTDGYINAFYVHQDVDRPGTALDRNQSRVKMGFLPNYLGFNVANRVGDLNFGARASFWVTINDSSDAGTATAIDVRQFYGTVGGDWGEVTLGKDFGLFARSNILRDELLSGFGHASDLMGILNWGGVSFGNIGSGYPYAFPSAQITYRMPTVAGFNLAVGVLDPYDTTDASQVGGASYQDSPRVESEISYTNSFGDAELYAWVNGAWQHSRNTDPLVDSVTSSGVGYGVQMKVQDLSVTVSGFNADGMHPFFTNNLGQASLQEVDSKGHLAQIGYQFGKLRAAASYGRTQDDGLVTGNRLKLTHTALQLSYAVTPQFTLVANGGRFEARDGGVKAEETDTVAVGAALSW